MTKSAKKKKKVPKGFSCKTSISSLRSTLTLAEAQVVLQSGNEALQPKEKVVERAC